MATNYLKDIRAKNAKAGQKDDVAHEFMERFEFYYQQSSADLARIAEFQSMYDNVVNEGVWPTNTQLPIPFLFSTVHDTLPGALDYLFPKGTKWVGLVPNDDMDAERLEAVEWATQMQIVHRMRVAKEAYPSIHSCFKCGVGYGAIEPYVFTPPAIYNASAFAGGRAVARAQVLRPGRPRLGLRYVDVNPGEIIVSKDGSEFNGHKRVSHAFRFTTYTEHEFRRMFAGKGDSEAITLKGNVEALIEEAYSLGFVSSVPIQQEIARLAGVDTLALSKDRNRYIDVRVPVLKVYTENRHIWIANGTKVIFDESDKFSTMMTPLVKWSAWPDGDRWYPPSAIEVAQKQAIGMNLWINVMFDILVEAARPILAYNPAVMRDGKRPERGPNGEIAVNGDPRAAAIYLEPPKMDQGMFNMGEIMQRWYGNTIGRQIGEITPGLLRSGVNAFEGVMQTMRGKERLANAVLEMFSLEDLVRLTLLHMQTMGEGDTYSWPEWDDETGREYIRRVSITPQDMLHVFDVHLDLEDKYRTSSMDEHTRLARYNALSRNPYFDQYENIRQLIGNDYRFRRGMPSRKKVREMQEQERAARLQAIRQGAGGQAAGTQVEAAAAGLQQ